MNDVEAMRLLQGIDGPRPMPRGLDAALADALTVSAAKLASVDAPRPLPEDLRRRIEASLVAAAPRPLPRPVARRLERALAPSLLRSAAAAAAVLALVVGVLAAVQDRHDLGPRDVASPITTTTIVTGAATGTGGSSAGSTASGAVGAPFVQPAAPAPAASATASGSASAGAHADSTSIEVAVTGDLDSAVARGFQAYLDVLNGAGGIGGRPVAASPHAREPVAVVNVGMVPIESDQGGVVLETAFVEESRLAGAVVSLSSPVERQARLAVRHAYPDPAPGRSAAVYVGAVEPFATVVPNAFAAGLREQGVTVVRVPFDRTAPAFVPADAAFLALDPNDAARWIDVAPGAPTDGVWGIGSAWRDESAVRAEALGMTVLSPYRPVGGDEQAALAAAIGEPLSIEAVHGWVTGKALALLLTGSPTAGTRLTEADLDRLVGWDPGWAPPFEFRPGTRSRTPDAVPLRAADATFVVAGDFERA